MLFSDVSAVVAAGTFPVGVRARSSLVSTIDGAATLGGDDEGGGAATDPGGRELAGTGGVDSESCRITASSNDVPAADASAGSGAATCSRTLGLRSPITD
jgi:hypothetical protein